MKTLFAGWSVSLTNWLGSLVLYGACLSSVMHAAGDLDSRQVRGLCIGAPRSTDADSFLRFVREVLVPAKVNTLVLRVDYNYEFTSHPELRDRNALSKAQVAALVALCREHQIRLIPQINLLGHQSWHSRLSNLLRLFPEFDETPHVQLPEEYQWPNKDGLYCKSYCPRHPDVHGIVLALVDEIVDVFEADAFHAGMDEVFYLGDPKCPRCANVERATLFAEEVALVRDHLHHQGKELWIWGDRLIEGVESGIGIWEGSGNDTWPAVDRIPKDVVICDWHYEQAVPTAAYFALKGLRVVSCPWRNAEVAKRQLADMTNLREQSPKAMSARFLGVMQTVWSSPSSFIKRYRDGEKPESGRSDVVSFQALIQAWSTASNAER